MPTLTCGTQAAIWCQKKKTKKNSENFASLARAHCPKLSGLRVSVETKIYKKKSQVPLFFGLSWNWNFQLQRVKDNRRYKINDGFHQYNDYKNKWSTCYFIFSDTFVFTLYKNQFREREKISGPPIELH